MLVAGPVAAGLTVMVGRPAVVVGPVVVDDLVVAGRGPVLLRGQVRDPLLLPGPDLSRDLLRGPLLHRSRVLFQGRVLPRDPVPHRGLAGSNAQRKSETQWRSEARHWQKNAASIRQNNLEVRLAQRSEVRRDGQA